jgi:hypothetical protein
MEITLEVIPEKRLKNSRGLMRIRYLKFSENLRWSTFHHNLPPRQLVDTLENSLSALSKGWWYGSHHQSATSQAKPNSDCTNSLVFLTSLWVILYPLLTALESNQYFLAADQRALAILCQMCATALSLDTRIKISLKTSFLLVIGARICEGENFISEQQLQHETVEPGYRHLFL